MSVNDLRELSVVELQNKIIDLNIPCSKNENTPKSYKLTKKLKI